MNVTAQIDGNLLLGLTPIADSNIGTITTPVEGSLFYNIDEQKIFLRTSTGFSKIPSIDTNSIDFWSALGTSGTNPSLNFLGTTDAQDMVFKANNTERLRLSGSSQTVLLNGASLFNNHPIIIKANGDDIMAFQTAVGTTEWHLNLLGNGFNFVETGVADYRIFIEQGGNIGLSTGTPSERLDVDGALRVRSIATTVSDLDVLVTTAAGVVQKRLFSDFAGLGPQGDPGIDGTDGVDGTDGTDGISVTAATLNSNKELVLTLSDANTINAGQVIPPKLNFGGRWTNTDTATNLNVNGVNVPIFGTQNYKDDGNNLYEANVNEEELTVKEAGRYDIRANIALRAVNSTGTTERHTSVNVKLAVNGTAIGALTASGYIRYQTNHRNSSLHINEILELNANDVITITTLQEANSGIVRFSAANESSFMINKLK